MSFLQLQPICNKLERLHETFQSREEILSKLDASAADVEASLLHNKVVEAENRGLLSENEDLKRVVMIGFPVECVMIFLSGSVSDKSG